MEKVNYEIAMDMLKNMPEKKKEVLKNALSRNYYLTSNWAMEFGTMIIYKEGFLLRLEGTRCSFSVFAYDRDGELEFARKPIENCLNKLYEDDIDLSELDFFQFA